MRYTLKWCPELGMFEMTDFQGQVKLLTNDELRAKLNENAVLNEWADYAVAHPNVNCDYEMLPRAIEPQHYIRKEREERVMSTVGEE